MLRNAVIAALLLAWFVAVVACSLCKQWPAVCCLFSLAWLVEQSITYATDEE